MGTYTEHAGSSHLAWQCDECIKLAYHESGHTIAMLLRGGGQVFWVRRVRWPDGSPPEATVMRPQDIALQVCKRRWFAVKLARLEAERRVCLAMGWPFDWRHHGAVDWPSARRAFHGSALPWASVQQHGRPMLKRETV
jgi:hypothetical protein